MFFRVHQHLLYSEHVSLAASTRLNISRTKQALLNSFKREYSSSCCTPLDPEIRLLTRGTGMTAIEIITYLVKIFTCAAPTTKKLYIDQYVVTYFTTHSTSMYREDLDDPAWQVNNIVVGDP